MKKIAISLGDVNGIGLEIALREHKKIRQICTPVYCINKDLLEQGADLLKIKVEKDFNLSPCGENFKIKKGKISKKSGEFSFKSFEKAVELSKRKEFLGLCTLPIHKKAWELAGVKYKGHTEALRDFFKRDSIMLLGCSKLFVALYTDHIPLKKVNSSIKTKQIKDFFLNLYKNVCDEKIAVLGLNPHNGDKGLIGKKDIKIKKAIKKVNGLIKKKVFYGPIVPDTAFTPKVLKEFKFIVAMYHDQGLAPLKALYFEESINISLNLPIIRTSVDHGTAFDIAYKNKNINTKSYLNAIKYLLKLY